MKPMVKYNIIDIIDIFDILIPLQTSQKQKSYLVFHMLLFFFVGWVRFAKQKETFSETEPNERICRFGLRHGRL